MQEQNFMQYYWYNQVGSNSRFFVDSYGMRGNDVVTFTIDCEEIQLDEWELWLEDTEIKLKNVNCDEFVASFDYGVDFYKIDDAISDFNTQKLNEIQHIQNNWDETMKMFNDKALKEMIIIESFIRNTRD